MSGRRGDRPVAPAAFVARGDVEREGVERENAKEHEAHEVSRAARALRHRGDSLSHTASRSSRRFARSCSTASGSRICPPS